MMKHILIVDDEPPIRKLLSHFLEESGYRCRTAEDAETASAILAIESFDLLLSDINMPKVSGLELIRFVNQAYPEMASIIISAVDDPQRAKQALNLNVYGYIVKPFERNQILICVENALRRHELEMEAKDREARLERIVMDRTLQLENLLHDHKQIIKTSEKLIKRVEDQLVFMQTLIDSIPLPVYYKDTKGLFLGCNTAFEVCIGIGRSRIIGKSVHDVAPKRQADIHHEVDMTLIREPGNLIYESIVTFADGTHHEMILSKAAYRNAQGAVAGIVGTMLDITERKRIEEALRASEEKNRKILENIGLGVSLIGPGMEILELNRQMREWFPGIEPGDEPICFRTLHVPARETLCDDCPVVKTFQSGGAFEGITQACVRGENRTFRTVSSPIHDQAGNVTAVIELMDDITVKLALERELRQAQKLESIGQLSAGIAHEINNPIQYVGDNIKFFKSSFESLFGIIEQCQKILPAIKDGTFTKEMVDEFEDLMTEADIDLLAEEIPDAMKDTIEGVQRVSKIVHSMRVFSHPGTDQKTAVDINRALESTVTVARNEWKYVAEVETDFDPDLPFVSCLPGEINQVFLNLLVNAAHAIEEVVKGRENGKGRILISTRAQKETVEIRFRDTGGGIPETIQHRIFDPFFTTKAVGKGTGQGLAIAHSVIVEKHGGTLKFETQLNVGTTFIIQLPLSEKGP
ncbi:MAG: response regulator [Pseudomonadota bacterium]